jgi:hypothetical protein
MNTTKFVIWHKLPDGIKLTKLEQFVLQNSETDFDALADQLNRTPAAVSAACDRAHDKIRRHYAAQASRLNGIIASRNLYRNGERFVEAESSLLGITVLSLHREVRVEFHLDGSFVDGSLRPITSL